MQSVLVRLPPAGSPIPAATIRAILRQPDPEGALRRGLGDRLPCAWLSLHGSGREALRVAFRHLAATTGRDEVLVPGYSCPSVPAAAVAAGLRVRLVDVGLDGQIDVDALRNAPRERAAALVVCNLFGVPEPMSDVLALASEAGVPVVDDAAQSLGSRSAEGPVGSRGDVGLLSFGRSKPLSALGGGALVWRRRPATATDDLALGVAGDPSAPAQRARALLRALAYDVARIPAVLRILAAIPALGIGKTVYEPAFRQGAVHGASVALAAALLPGLDAQNLSRARAARAVAERLSADTGFRPILAAAGDVGIYPRLALLAPSAQARDTALRRLAWLGVTGMYPDPLDSIPALAPHLADGADGADCPGAREFCHRLTTVPTHAGLRSRHVDALTRELRQAG